MKIASSTSLSYLVYVSTATYLPTDEELFALLQKSRNNNSRCNITGMLLYKDGNFIQAIEGPAQEIASLEVRIAADSRHTGMIVLLRGTIEERLFPNWSMAFKPWKEFPLEQRTEINDFLQAVPTLVATTAPMETSNLHPAWKLLLNFRRFM